ncbi:alpha/beta fold hydrolase [Kitasatospora acidiphila]|uniref:alpha/beta fold hydrolase n=1 Tax=Kitasatospora acidiphila TaxID=2567942 RepID=UPI0038991628
MNGTAIRAELTIDGRRLSYLDFGGTGRPLVALHGHLSEGAVFTHLAQAVGPEWRVIAPDQRGQGESDRADDYSRDGYLGDLLALLDHLGLDRVVLLGHSLGASTPTSSPPATPSGSPRSSTSRARPRSDWTAGTLPQPSAGGAPMASCSACPTTRRPATSWWPASARPRRTSPTGCGRTPTAAGDCPSTRRRCTSRRSWCTATTGRTGRRAAARRCWSTPPRASARCRPGWSARWSGAAPAPRRSSWTPTT